MDSGAELGKCERGKLVKTFKISIEVQMEDGTTKSISREVEAKDAKTAHDMTFDDWMNFLYTATDQYRYVKSSAIKVDK